MTFTSTAVRRGDFVNLEDLLAQPSKILRGTVCVRAFIEVTVCAVSVYVVLCNRKKKGEGPMRGGDEDGSQ